MSFCKVGLIISRSCKPLGFLWVLGISFRVIFQLNSENTRIFENLYK